MAQTDGPVKADYCAFCINIDGVVGLLKKAGFKVFISLILIAAFTAAPALAAIEDKAGAAHNDAWGFPHKEGIVLVLSGGGTKGLSHIGVFEVLERENIPIAAIVGTSMGAIMGGLYASGYTAAEMTEVLSHVDLMEIISGRSGTKRESGGFDRAPSNNSAIFNFEMDKDKTLKGKLGLLNAKDLYSFLSELTSRAAVTDFDQLPIPFAALATDLETGEEVRLRNGNLASALRASMSIPGVFEPWELDGRLLVDGGLKANLPVIAAKEMFPGHPVVAVNLSPKHLTRKRDKLRSLLEVGAQTLEILMRDQLERNLAEADLVISPHVSDFGVLATDGYDQIIERGLTAANRKTDELRAMAQKANTDFAASVHSGPMPYSAPTVAEVRFEGIPEMLADELQQKVSSWLDKPLDMKKVSNAVRQISDQPEFNSVAAKAERLSKNTVALVFSIERPSKYEFGIGGYGGNIYPDAWLSLSAQVRDILMAGDIGSLEYRLGNRWGLMGRYFTAMNSSDSQFGLVLSAREEGLSPRNIGVDFEYERFSARAAWYRSFSDNFRAGVGYAVERVTGDLEDGETRHGPYLNVSFNNLDDPLLPTKGVAITSDIWIPSDGTAVTSTAFTSYLPIWDKWKVIFSGGLKTGDMTEPAYAAILGNHEELYSLAHRPMIGDQVYWLHLGAARTMMKSWWGGINVELFGNYGQALFEWDNMDDWWEVGIGLSIPTNNLAGKVVVVYDQGGDFTFGYSIGIPNWWSGPLP